MTDVERSSPVSEVEPGITTKRWTSLPLQDWLLATHVTGGNYGHLLLVEEASSRAAGLAAVAGLATDAHRDVRNRLERLIGISLDPLGEEATKDWQYPDALHTSVLQGYFGELLAGVIAENYQPHKREWIVPAFLFRGHLAAYQDLERRRQLGGPARPIPGRTGDDALAFEVDDSGAIIAWLWAEAKCTHDHNPGLISAAHEQLSTAVRIPVDTLQLIEILQESASPEAERWIAALRELLFSSTPPPRFDMVVYVCGRSPKSRATWISQEAVHAQYRRTGPLRAAEIHLKNFDEVLLAAYPGHVINRG